MIADALVHTVIRKNINANLPMRRIKDTFDYYSSPEEAAQTATRGGTRVLTHFVSPIPAGGADLTRRPGGPLLPRGRRRPTGATPDRRRHTMNRPVR